MSRQALKSPSLSYSLAPATGSATLENSDFILMVTNGYGIYKRSEAARSGLAVKYPLSLGLKNPEILNYSAVLMRNSRPCTLLSFFFYRQVRLFSVYLYLTV